MYTTLAQSSRAQQLLQAQRLPLNSSLRTRCRRASTGRSTLVSPRATLDIPVDTTPYLVVDDPREVAHRFGQPGNFVDKGREPYKGAGYKKTPHNDLKPGALYGPGRYLVQNKGRVLYAAAKPFPEGAVKAANQTEQAIILAIAMQESEYMDTRDIGNPVKTDGAENRSCLNACVDMLRRANGGSWPPVDTANAKISAVDELHMVVGCLLRWLRGQVRDQQGRDEHLKDTLNFLRGGYPTFRDHGKIYNSHLEVNTDDSLNAIASIYRELRWKAKGAKWDDGMKHEADQHWNGFENWEPDNLYANNTRIQINIPGI